MRTPAAVLLMMLLSGAARAADADLWSVEVTADGAVAQGDVERAAGGLRAGLRGVGKVVAPEGGAAPSRLVGHLSETPDDFALRLEGAAAEAVSGPRILLEDGARQLAVHRLTLTGRIVLPADLKAEWFVDGRKVAPEAGTTLVVSRGTHAVRANTAAGTVALVMVDVAGGATVPFPRLVPGSLAIAGLAGPELAVAKRAPAPVASARRIPWLWIGVAAGAVVAAGAAAALADRPGSSTTTVVPGGPGTTTITVKQ